MELKTMYSLENKSKDIGTYTINNEEKLLYPTERRDFDKLPENISENLNMSIYRRRVGESPITKKRRTK